MVFKKKLNNNVIVAVDSQGNEQILMGCGLGFQKEEGSTVEESKVEKVFMLSDSKMNERFKELLKNIPMDHVKLADELISYAGVHVNGKLSENLILSLCDHIYMAVERKKLGIDVKNVLLWDIQRYYRDEYSVGEYAVDLIKERFGVELTKDEAGFIAMHIINAQMELQTQTVREITVVIEEIETIVQMTFGIPLDVESVYYYRFITHLKFFAEQLFSNKAYAEGEVSGLAEVIKAQYPKAYGCSMKIAAFIEDKYRYHLGEEEILYLSIHIARMAEITHQM